MFEKYEERVLNGLMLALIVANAALRFYAFALS